MKWKEILKFLFPEYQIIRSIKKHGFFVNPDKIDQKKAPAASWRPFCATPCAKRRSATDGMCAMYSNGPSIGKRCGSAAKPIGPRTNW